MNNIIGLIGGMSWESTVSYYKHLNELYKAKHGGLSSCELMLYSVDFSTIAKCQVESDWAGSAEILSNVAMKLESAGASKILLCTNTMHKVADDIQNSISIPFVNIIDETYKEIINQGYKKPCLLGTLYTMEDGFYQEKMEQLGVTVVTPSEEDRKTVHDIIYKELCLGVISDKSKEEYINIINKVKASGADSIILGCTEISLLIKPEDIDIGYLDTTLIHSKSAIE